jgi:hypothetical protein
VAAIFRSSATFRHNMTNDTSVDLVNVRASNASGASSSHTLSAFPRSVAGGSNASIGAIAVELGCVNSTPRALVVPAIACSRSDFRFLPDPTRRPPLPFPPMAHRLSKV